MRSGLPLRLLLLLLLPALAGCPDEAARGERPGAQAPLTVGAAASLRHVMPELAEVFMRQHPDARLVFAYGGSGHLRRQVEAGAPIHAVVFAHPAPLEALVARGLVVPQAVREVASNTLVLVGRRERAGAPPSSPRPTFRTLHALAQGEWLAIGEPDTVPAGQYAREALMALGQWEALVDRQVRASDVAAVLNYVRRGEAALGVVYRTDLRAAPDVELLDTATADFAPVARYVAAPLDPAAAAFVEFLAHAPEARAVWAAHGFGVP